MDRLAHGVQLGERLRRRLLDQDMLARAGGGDRVLRVKLLRRADGHDVDARHGQRLRIVVQTRHGEPRLRRTLQRVFLRNAADRNNLRMGIVLERA